MSTTRTLRFELLNGVSTFRKQNISFLKPTWTYVSISCGRSLRITSLNSLRHFTLNFRYG